MYFAFTDEEKQCTHSSCLKGVLLAKVPGSQIRHFFACVLILFWDDQVKLKNCVWQMGKQYPPLPPHLKSIFSKYPFFFFTVSLPLSY